MALRYASDLPGLSACPLVLVNIYFQICFVNINAMNVVGLNMYVYD